MNENEHIQEMAREMCHLSAECETCQICNERYHGEEGELCYFQCIAKEIISHDYRKVERGEWIYQEYSMGHHVGKCTICECEADMTNFCPHCGADMRGEDDV